MVIQSNEITRVAELYRCVLFQTPVNIQMQDRGSVSEMHRVNDFNEDILYVDGAYFFRSCIQVERVELKTDAELYNSILFQTPIEVRTNGFVDTYITSINEFTDDVIFIDNAFYFRSDSCLLLA